MTPIPHDTQAEAALLACCLQDPSHVVPELVRHGCAVRHFHDLRHQLLWHTIAGTEQPASICPITIKTALGDKLEQAGGLAYLAELPDKSPSAHNWPSYWAILKDQAYRRAVLATSATLAKAAVDPAENMEEVAARAESEVLALAGHGAVKDGTRQQEIQEVIDYMEQAFTSQGASMGLRTGFRGVDRLLNGLRGGAMYVIAARPKCFKTQWCLNVAENVAEQGHPVGWFGLEMGKVETNLRTIARYSGVNVQKVLQGEAVEADFVKLAKAAAKAKGLPLHILDRAGCTIAQIRSEARHGVAKHGWKLVVVDYLQLVQGDGKEGRTQEVEAISRGCKLMAKELGVPVIVISQLNREVEKENRLPRPSDLRQSGAIEQDADGVGFLHVESDKEDGESRVPVKFLLALHRHGGTGMADLVAHKTLNKLEDASPVW
jgi:replicative DNA helicase